MSLARRVATLHPLFVSATYVGAVSLAFLTDFARFSHIPLLLIVTGWPLGLYVAARDNITPAPIDRYPMFARIMFGIAVAGSVANALLAPTALIEPKADIQTVAFILVGATFGIGIWASIFLAADALIKAETGKPWLANPRPTQDTAGLIAFLPLGIWLLYPRIQRAVAAT